MLQATAQHVKYPTKLALNKNSGAEKDTPHHKHWNGT